MRAVLIVSLSLCWTVSIAVAQTGPAQPPAAKPPGGSAPAVGGPAAGGKKGKVVAGQSAGKRPEAPPETDPLGSCLAMWDPTTHMTRREWARACRRVADRLKGTSAK